MVKLNKLTIAGIKKKLQLPLPNLSARLSLLAIREESPDSKEQHTG